MCVSWPHCLAPCRSLCPRQLPPTASCLRLGRWAYSLWATGPRIKSQILHTSTFCQKRVWRWHRFPLWLLWYFVWYQRIFKTNSHWPPWKFLRAAVGGVRWYDNGDRDDVITAKWGKTSSNKKWLKKGQIQYKCRKFGIRGRLALAIINHTETTLGPLRGHSCLAIANMETTLWSHGYQIGISWGYLCRIYGHFRLILLAWKVINSPLNQYIRLNTIIKKIGSQLSFFGV